jgi:hypothetical protein
MPTAVELTRRVLASLAVAAALAPAAARAQIGESAHDLTGVSIPYPLTHLVHATDPGLSGATADLLARDPFLLYQLGRDLVQRQYQLRHGVYGRAGELSVPLYVGGPGAAGSAGPARFARDHTGPARFARDHTSSCGFCHSTPYREPGAGQTMASTGSMGRNTPHFFGAGLTEMLGEQVRQTLLARCDGDGDGVIDRAEVARPCPAVVVPAPGAPAIDYGDLAPEPDGVPRLDPIFRVWYLDAGGDVLPDALGLDDPRVAAFNFAMQPFGWGRGWATVAGRRVAQGGEAATVRSFFTAAADVHMGLQADDPTQRGGRHGVAGRSLAGALQLALSAAADPGGKRSPAGFSFDDPDGDGHASELTEGDLDAAEVYMLHAPAPAVLATAESERGRTVLAEVGCLSCHVETWQIEAEDEARGFAGDRRLFDFETRTRLAADGVPELVARLVPLSTRLASGVEVPRRGAFRVERIYTDFRHRDLGPAFWERRFDSTLQRQHRTAPLWGVGSTAPYGHAGSFPTLDAVIRAHGGEAERERDAYAALPEARRRLLLGYLESLVLYPTDEIPCDVDGDGIAAGRFEVAGQEVGYERFDARFLLARPPRYRRLQEVADYRGRRRFLMVIENVAEAFGLDLPHRRDGDGDGVPDVADPVPERAGVDDERDAQISGR